MHPENSEIITEQKDGIATIQLNRPKWVVHTWLVLEWMKLI